MKGYGKIHKALGVFRPFYTNQWSFEVDNVVKLRESMTKLDAEEFPIDVRLVDWVKYPEAVWMGCRRYMLKEPDSSIPQALQRYRRLCLFFSGLKWALILFGLFACYSIFP